MCFIERETHNFILKFRKKIPVERNSAQDHRMTSDKSRFSVKFMQILQKKWNMLTFTGIFLYF